MAANLKKMTRGELVKLGKSLGLRPMKSWSDVKLRNEIRHARKPAWPKDWPEEMREEYFASIVGAPMPLDDSKAYAHLMKVIDQKVPEISPTMTKEGPDCFGIFYEPNFTYCNEVCPLMPLCKAACERRPELAKIANAMDSAKAEVDKLSDKDAKAAAGKPARKKKVTKKKATKKPKLGSAKKKVRRKASDDVYVWVGDVQDYLEVDEDVLEIIRWMSGRKRRGFTFAECVKQFEEYFEDAEDTAKNNLDLLVEQGDVRIK